MTTKQDPQYTFEECPCMEMMSQMMSESKGQQDSGDACAEMMAKFADPETTNSEFFETIPQMMASCCGLQVGEDKTFKEV